MTEWGARRACAAAAVAALTLSACGSLSGEPTRATLAGSESSPTSAPAPAEADIAPEPGGDETPSGGEPWDDAATAACEQAVAPGYRQVAQSVDGAGVTTFWLRGGQGMLCDVAEGAEQVSLVSAPGRSGFDEESLALSVTSLPDSSVRLVAGGMLPWPVEELTYAFPGGHTESARFVTSGGATDRTWWVVTHTATEGPLTEAGAASADPLTISVVGASAEAFRLPWEDALRSEE
jgi:hypothetical protein